ncbi:TrmB family transcriptional regulator [Candidatus Bathyarchaeota archaeon]|nr:MAG: TrmB family transcriptional regulator [Candidatus Bathyarchaeota archaeon]
MMVSETTRRALKEFGLTEYEVKAYIALVESGPMPASQLSTTAAIPYSKIYEILGNLERKGWVESEQGRPSKYFPKPPSAALESSRVRMENTLKSSQTDAMSELQPLYEKKRVQERPDIWIVRGQNNILDRIKETLGRTKRELLVAMPIVPDSVISMATPLLSLMNSRGVKVSVMIPSLISKEITRKLKGLAEVRVREQMFGGGIISDSNEIILLLGEEPERGLTLAISSDHAGLVRFGKSYFEFLWENSKPC